MSPIGNVESIYDLLTSIIPSKGPNSYGALASSRSDGQACVRMVVLRGLKRDENLLWVNTNARSGKVAHLRQNPVAEVALWLPRRKLQLRLRATWRVVDAALAGRSQNLAALRQQAWTDQPALARRLYSWPDPDQAMEPDDEPENPKGVKTRTPPRTFAVLLGSLDRIDALRLTKPVHERFVFERERQVWQTRRVTP
jgi:hypothetical protein